MSKVLFLNGPAHGHINPTLPLVEELIKRGEEVTYFCTNEFRNKIEKAGATFKEYVDPVIKQFSKREMNHLFDKVNILIQSSEAIVPNILRQIEGERFDYIIHDATLGSGKIIGNILNIPSISTSTTFIPPKMLLKIDEEAIKNDPRIINFFKISNKFKETYGINPPSISDVFTNPEKINLVFTSTYFQPGAEVLDSSYKFIGPSIGDRKEEINFPFDRLKEKKVIYISMGTIVNDAAEIYKECFEAFGKEDMTVVLSVGNQIDITKLGYIPENFIVKNYVPQLEVLKYTDVFISHGGMNSVSESLYYNVPLVMIPISADQPFVAYRVSELGAGIFLPKEKLNAESLNSSVKALIYEENYYKNAKIIGESFRLSGGYKKAADIIFEFKNTLF